MSHYLKKQFVIFVIFLIILGVVGTGFYFLINPPEKATCNDGVQNQGEEKIDCGGPCRLCEKERQPLEIIYKKLIPTIENNFDIVVQVMNLNRDWGSAAVYYRLNLYDDNNNLVGFKDGSVYILPQEKKYIIEPKVYSDKNPKRVEVEFKDIAWQKVGIFSNAELRISEERFQAEAGFNRFSGVIENKTSYNLSKVEIVGIIFGKDKEILAAGKTEINTLSMGENRYFEIKWPYYFGERETSFYSEAYTNIFAEENFIKTQGTQGF